MCEEARLEAEVQWRCNAMNLDVKFVHAASEHYALWPKARESPLVREFADVLKGLFE